MNQKVIWLIIGLMSAALIGVAGMQLKWIIDTLAANEEQFDNKIFTALNGVAGKLAYQEELEFMQHVDNGYAQSYMAKDAQQRVDSGEIASEEVHQDSTTVQLTKQQLLEQSISSNSCDCANCRADRAKKFSQFISYAQGVNLTPIVERVKLNQVDEFLKQELDDKGIKLPFKYGVYDDKKKSFVIANGSYMVPDEHAVSVQEGYENLYNSPYKVSLFQQEMKAPGHLMVFFPAKGSFLWGSVMKTLLGSILFMSIILFCFAYTISVIFRQKKVSEMKNDFINNMTHEFKTPIATISLAADSIASPMIVSQPDKIRRFIDIIRQENKRMNNQVEKVLQMAQIDRRDFDMHFSSVNLHEVIKNAVDYISLQVERKDGTVTTDLKATNATVEGDMTHISNIINNLLDNANKYSPETPEISVATRNVSNGLEVTVSDKGIGMSKESKKHIFEKFYRVHTGNLHDVKGFGLGLSYVKAMMAAHKGTVEAKSELGKGSSFVLFFPFKGEGG